MQGKDTNTVGAMKKIRAVLFDAYGTLFDVYSIALLAEQLFPDQGQRLAQVWRDKQIEYTRLINTSNHGAHYQPFWTLTEAALRYAIKTVAPDARAQWDSGGFQDHHRALKGQYRQLSVFPEAREVLTALRERGLATGILSNGDPEMLGISVRSAGLEELLDHVISVHPVRLFKTAPEAYALGPAATGVAADETLFVSANSWDALAATWFGYQTLWVNRQNMPFDELGTAPHHTGTSLRDALHCLG
jgi:2-haloacid dehalogenase